MALIDDAEFLAMSLAAEALAGVSSDVRDAARETASAYVRTRIKPSYSNVDEAVLTGFDVKDCVAAQAAWRALAYRGVSDADPTWKVVQERYAASEKWLDMIRDGEAELLGAEKDKGGAKVSTSGTPRWSKDAYADPYSGLGGIYTGIDLGDGES